MRRRWTINGRFLTQRITGVQRYAHEIVGALDDLLTSGDPLTSHLDLELLAPPSCIFKPDLKSIKTKIAGFGGGHLWEQVFLPLHARGGIVSLCNTSTLVRRRQIVCIHDVNTITVPQSYTVAFRTFYGLALPAVGRLASVVATVSEYSASQIATLGIAPAPKVTVIPDGYEHVGRWNPNHSSSTRLAAGPDSIIVMGSFAPHKNISLLLSSIDKLTSHGFRLVIVGGFDHKVFQNGAIQDLQGVTRLTGVSDDELAALLKDSLCLAFPSIAEGFGLPPLEAMALGCPVVVTDRTSLPEICGNAALYAPAEDAGAWLKCFLDLRNDQSLRNRQIARGLDRAKRYQWRTSARLYLRAMAIIDGVADAKLESNGEWGI
jgi:glycosyltransferase involved in cell wall biosynthesis